MALALEIPEATRLRAEKIASRNGDTVQATLLRALETCFPSLPDDLQTEFDAWDAAADEDFEKWLNWER